MGAEAGRVGGWRGGPGGWGRDGGNAGEFGEGEVAGFGEFADADGATTSVQRHSGRAAVDGDGFVFDAGAFLDASLVPSGLCRVGVLGGDPVDGEEAEVAQQ